MASTSTDTSLSSSSSGVIESPFALLEGVEQAIGKVSTFQSYRLGDRTVTYADLSDLMAMRATLLAEVNSRQGTCPRASTADFSALY